MFITQLTAAVFKLWIRNASNPHSSGADFFPNHNYQLRSAKCPVATWLTNQSAAMPLVWNLLLASRRIPGIGQGHCVGLAFRGRITSIEIKLITHNFHLSRFHLVPTYLLLHRLQKIAVYWIIFVFIPGRKQFSGQSWGNMSEFHSYM